MFVVVVFPRFVGANAVAESVFDLTRVPHAKEEIDQAMYQPGYACPPLVVFSQFVANKVHGVGDEA